MRLELIQAMQLIIIALLAYIPTVTFTGWFEAWVSKKCGDDLPEQFGFLTLDPMVHFNLVGFGFLLVGQLFGNFLPIFKDIPGWGRYMPLSPSQHNGLKAFLQYTARAFAHLLLLVVAFFSIICIVGKPSSLGIVPGSALFDSIRDVLVFFYRQNFVLCIIYFVIGMFRYMLFSFFPNFHLFSTQQLIQVFLLLMLFVLVGSPIIEFLLATMMDGLNYLFIAH